MPQCFQSTHISVASPDGKLIATIHQSHLLLRSSLGGETVQDFELPQNFAATCRYVRWYKANDYRRKLRENRQDFQKPERVLLANDDIVLVYDANDAQWRAEISGAASDLDSIANVEFGRTQDEIMVFSDFNVKVTIWSLITNRGIDIRDPKALVHGYGHRPQTGHLAILTRDTAHDTVMLLDPYSLDLYRTFDPATADAQGLRWSPDGRWLAIWDTASSGYKVLIYTADGHLFKTYLGEQDAHNVGLGVKTLLWSPTAESLAIGDYSERVTLLAKNTVSPTHHFDHSHTVSLRHGVVWQEQIDATKKRSYIEAPQPACPPTRASLSIKENLRTGVSAMGFNNEGDLIATRSDSIPSTVWIWSTKISAAVAVIMHHSPIKKIQWHPTIADLLLIHCAISEPTLHLWRATWEKPLVIYLRLDRPGGRTEVSWLLNETKDLPTLMLSNLHNYVTAQIMSNGEGIVQSLKSHSFGAGPEDMFDEGNSFDLSPIRIPQENSEGSFGHDESGNWNHSDAIDDTFHYRR